MAYFNMSDLVLKWAFKKPITVNYPFEPRIPVEGCRGQLEFLKETCTYCGVCGKRCPTKAITVTRNPAKTWGLDRLLCISCGCCVEVCPKDSLKLNTSHGVPSVTKDKELY